MVSIIFVVLGVMFIFTGLGLRPLVRAFGTAFSILGGVFFLDGVFGWYFGWRPQWQLWIAGGTLILFTIMTSIWQLMVKFKELKKLNEVPKK